MKGALKVVGAILIALSLIPGAISLWQAYGAYTFSTSSLNSGRYGSFGRQLAEHAAEVRMTRAVIFGGISFVFGVGGVISLVIGLKKPKGGAAGQPQQGYAQQQPQQGQPQQGYAQQQPQQGQPQQGYAQQQPQQGQPQQGYAQQPPQQGYPPPGGYPPQGGGNPGGPGAPPA